MNDMHEKFNTVTPRPTIAHRRKRRTLRGALYALVDGLLAEFELSAAEARHHISRIEAAAVDDFQTDMANVTDSPEGRQRLRDAALALGQLGISGFEDVEKMVQGHYVMDLYGLSLMDVRKIGEIKAGGRRI